MEKKHLIDFPFIKTQQFETKAFLLRRQIKLRPTIIFIQPHD